MQQSVPNQLSQEMEAHMFDGPLQEMMKQAQKVAEQMKEAQAKLSEKEVVGESGAGLVSVTLNGQGDCKSVGLTRMFWLMSQRLSVNWLHLRLMMPTKSLKQ